MRYCQVALRFCVPICHRHTRISIVCKDLPSQTVWNHVAGCNNFDHFQTSSNIVEQMLHTATWVANDNKSCIQMLHHFAGALEYLCSKKRPGKTTQHWVGNICCIQMLHRLAWA